jgi:hypothetical protein
LGIPFSPILMSDLPHSAPRIALDAEQIDFVLGPVSICVAGCGTAAGGRAHAPSLGRAFGRRVAADRRAITLFIAASHAPQLMKDLAANGAIAVVFSRPETHRAMQLKGEVTAIGPLVDGDITLVAAYRAAFIDELAALGYAPQLVAAFLDCADADLVAVTFEPACAFVQTPGPQAGEPLRGQA